MLLSSRAILVIALTGLMTMLAVSDALAYRAVLRAYCIDTSNGSDRGYAEVEADSPNSCQEARNEVLRIANQRGDICQRTGGINDLTKKESGRREWPTAVGPNACQ